MFNPKEWFPELISVEQEIILASCIVKSSVYIKSIDPEAWANIQYEIGNIYLKRITGNKSENIELAINAFNLALEVFKKRQFDKEWLDIQYLLAGIYFNKTTGNKITNLNLSISSYEKYLKRSDAINFSSEVLKVAEELEKTCLFALEYFGFEDFLMIKNALTLVASKRYFISRENTRERQKQEKILKEQLRDELEWKLYAKLINKLFTSSITLFEHEKYFSYDLEFNLEKVSDIFRQDGLKEEEITNRFFNLAYLLQTTYYPYISHGSSHINRRINLAIKSYELALKLLVSDPLYCRKKWAKINYYLAIIYTECIQGSKQENLDLAIIACKSALEVYASKADLQSATEWAKLQYCLGNIYEQRIDRKREEYFNRPPAKVSANHLFRCRAKLIIVNSCNQIKSQSKPSSSVPIS